MDRERLEGFLAGVLLAVIMTAFIVSMICGYGCAATAYAQEIRRPPAINTCDKCPPIGSYWCEALPESCNACWLTCGEQPGEPPHQVRPLGPPIDPWLGGYSLPKTIAVTQVHHEDVPWAAEPLRHMSNLDLAHEVWLSGFGGLKVWIQEGPFNGSDFSWTTPWGVPMFTPDSEGYGEDMTRFWMEQPLDLLIVRPQWYAWTGEHQTPELRMTYMDADFYAIAKRLYQDIGHRDMVVILTDWEQDWLYETYPQWVIGQIEKRQEDVERARKEAYLELGYRPNLRVMHSVIVNRYPANGAEEGKTLAEQIPKLKHRPDLIGLSYWKRGVDPRETLDWLRSVTHYPPSRIYIDELGGDEWEQAERFGDYIPVIQEWGVRVICVWMWKQTWCDPAHNRGLWQQAQPCQGKPVFTDPTAGYYTLQTLMGEQ